MLDLQQLRQWAGRSERYTDTIRPQPARFMEITLDKTPTLDSGMSLPPLWHWLYFLETAPLSKLGADGHAATGVQLRKL